MNNLLLEYKAALANKYNIDKMISHIVEKEVSTLLYFFAPYNRN